MFLGFFLISLKYSISSPMPVFADKEQLKINQLSQTIWGSVPRFQHPPECQPPEPTMGSVPSLRERRNTEVSSEASEETELGGQNGPESTMSSIISIFILGVMGRRIVCRNKW